MTEELKQYRVVELKAENIKKLKAVTIRPEGNTVILSGANGAGKTSVLDAIFWALKGKDSIQSSPIRHGEEKAQIDLSFGSIVITRKFKLQEDGAYTTTVEVKTPEGAKFSSPQDFLNRLLGEISFDPLSFSNMEPRDQLNLIKRALKMDGTLESLQAEEKTLFASRRDLKRDADRMFAACEAKAEGLPNEKPAPVDVTEKMKVIQAANSRAGLIAASNELNRVIKNTQDGIEELKNRIKNGEKIIQESLDKQRDIVSQIEALPTDDEAKLAQEAIEDSQRIMATIQKIDDLARDTQAYEAAKKQADEAETKLQAVRDKIKKVMDSLKMPVEGMELREGALFYNGVPYDQCSSAERLRLAVAIGMAENPQVRIVQIRDGSLLDSKNLALIEDLAKEYNFQAWIERTDESGQIGIVIEDGEVKNETAAHPA